ncbi:MULTISPECIES: hypothetical protein [unclassified Rhizobium]|uniref:hypothetical protein n=1 Tax=unclassified Rhizobium TaxID=2613769 RepID=UPI0007EAAC05|nr:MULTISPECIES: hypothetical protein [unclassified Rhizobium]ARO22152.1 hypothetical protein TAL182_CH00324 [Rhizobium sp. TAL182]PDS95750.1 hypothetical protein CO659_22335 [Rhizobium sp. S9]
MFLSRLQSNSFSEFYARKSGSRKPRSVDIVAISPPQRTLAIAEIEGKQVHELSGRHDHLIVSRAMNDIPAKWKIKNEKRTYAQETG